MGHFQLSNKRLNVGQRRNAARNEFDDLLNDGTLEEPEHGIVAGIRIVSFHDVENAEDAITTHYRGTDEKNHGSSGVSDGESGLPNLFRAYLQIPF